MKRRGFLWIEGGVAILAASAAFAQEPLATFKTDVRLVEIYATVFDSKGRYLDGLTREQFTVLDNEQPETIEAFESSTAGLSCAILLDHTGSMADALPVVKNAVVKLIDQLRADDWVAVYSFSTNLHTLQRFTRDKQVAKQAVLRTR